MTDREREIRERVEAATPGPWTHHIDRSWTKPDRVISAPKMVIIRDEDCEQQFKEGRGDEENFDFIAHSREDIPWLLDQLAAARDRIAEMERERVHSDLLINNLSQALTKVEHERDAVARALRIQKKAWQGVCERELDGPLVDFAEAQIKRIHAVLEFPDDTARAALATTPEPAPATPRDCPSCESLRRQFDSATAALKAERDALKAEAERLRGDAGAAQSILVGTRQRWTEAQDRLAKVESTLIAITGDETDIFTNIDTLKQQRDAVVRKAKAFDLLVQSGAHVAYSRDGDDCWLHWPYGREDDDIQGPIYQEGIFNSPLEAVEAYASARAALAPGGNQ